MNNEIARQGDGYRPYSYPLAHFTPGVEQRPSTGSPHQGLDFASILRVIKEWKWLVLGVLAAGIALGLLSSLLTTKMYRAWVTLEVNPPTVEILDEKSREVSTQSSWDLMATQVGLLSSRTLAQRVAEDLNLAADRNFVGADGDASARLERATSRVAGGLRVIAPEEGQLIRFSYVSDSPEMAAKVANGVADGFIKNGLERRFEASAYARTFLQQQIAKTRAQLEKSERELVGYAQAEGIINTSSGAPGTQPTDANSLQGESLVALNQALAEATARRVMAEGAYRQAQLAGASSEANASTQALRQAKAGLEAEYQDKRTLMKPEHPDMISLRSRIDELDRQINKERSTTANAQATTLLGSYRAAQSAENNLRAQVAGLKGSVLNLRGRSIRYNILQREVDTNRGLYDALLQRYKAIGVGGSVGTSPVMIVDRAEVPGAPYKPNVLLNMLLGTVGGLVAGIALAFILEVLNDTIKTRDDVRNKLGQACLGVIPKERGKEDLLAQLEDPASAVSEAYSAVLASLRFSAETGAPKALLVTSANPNEGKSSSALALAQSYARRGETVLLIDSDLRRPAFKGVSTSHGVTDLLTSNESISAHVVRTQHSNLWLLPCGPIAPNPADLLSTGRFAEILDEAKEHFDRVVIDSPPALGIADATFLAAFAGHAMLVVESGRTRTNQAREAVERLISSGVHLVGVTLTKSAEGASRYGYASYRYGQVEDKRKEIIMISEQADA